MNAIDFSIDICIDINLGDILNIPPLNETWVGYSIHHRSAIFKSASQFRGIKGGSNYNPLYLLFDF